MKENYSRGGSWKCVSCCEGADHAEAAGVGVAAKGAESARVGAEVPSGMDMGLGEAAREAAHIARNQ